MSVRCKIEIKGNVMEAIVDSGAATNIITKGLLEKLGMKITESSNAVFSNVNGKKVPSLGKVDIKIKIKNTEIPMKVQVIDSTKRDLKNEEDDEKKYEEKEFNESTAYYITKLS